ncbi:uncharacterized protein J8A68_005033 [[Candida] subhashii]|uniref:Diphthine methyltransferase n=1 Tax=[Candida] subhashii TaxID=561895 RepID=A0A8J5QHG8_9ASCO|nr:uncharacterized protein J8A68_005033 [[Candida] subhashii]KAG7661455.1 hypothetical protein J8A68_005033 [[Candida] subhashii]
MSIPNSKRFAVTKTDLPPCCLRIHPENSTQIIIGTYKLEDNGTRHGSLNYYHYENNEFTLRQSFPTPGAILDVKFNPRDSTKILTVDSIGHVIYWNFENDQLSILNDKQVTDSDDILITSCLFSPTDPESVLLTFTDGTSALFNLNRFEISLWLDTQHELECWTGAFGEIGELSNVVYTGGDDSRLIAHDLRSGEHIWTTSRNQHDAGVVSILSPGPDWNTTNPHTLWTGSYDDQLRVFDLRVMDKGNPSLLPGYIPKLLHSENLGGGVWRLIPSPVSGDDRVLVCCMYDGARIVNLDEQSHFTVDRYFKRDHESMCYGADWSPDAKFVATCSFYDNVVQTWSPDEIDT